MASSSLGTLHVKVCSITVSGQSLKKRKAEIADNETSLYCLLFVAGGFAKVPSRPMELATWDQDMTFYLQQSFEFPLGATRSTLTLSIFYESCCEDNKWAQIVANIGHLPHNKTEEACFNVEEGVNNSKITASFSLELRFVSADAAKNATPTNAVRLKASGDFTKRDKGDLERLHADSKVSSSKKKAKKKASGFGQIFHKKRNRSRAFGQQFPPDEPVVPEIITSTVEWLRQSASKTHGLFRESASTADMDMLRKQWESGKDVSWDEVPSPHVVAGLLMTWLLQLPEPLITFDLYESLIAAEETVASRDSRVQFLARVLASLPVAHRMSLACIIEFVHFLSLNSEFNKMTSKNLAIVFGPALMRRRVENVKQIVQDSPIIVNIVQCMIEEYEPIFKGAARPAAGGGTAGGPTPLSAKVPLEAFLSRKHTWRKSLAGNIRPNEGMVTSILHNRDKLVAFQAMVRSSLSNVQDSIQYLGKELEDSSRWSQPDVEFCGSLWANLNTLVNSPFERPDGWLTSTPPDEFRTGESDEARATTCKALRSAFLELENSFTEIYERISVSMESQDAPDQTAVEFAVAASNIARIAKRLLEQFQDIVLNDMQFSLPVQSATSTHETQLTLEQMQHSVNSTIDEIQAIKLPGLRKALASVTSLQDAVAITRVLRATKNALEQRSREPLSEFVAKVRSPVPMTDLEREKLASIIELLEEPFDEVGQLLEQLRSDVSALQDVYDTVEPEQLLVDTRRFLDEYLTQCQSKPVAATPEAERPGWRAPRPMGGNRAFGGFLRPTASAGARPTSPLLGSHHLPAASAAASSEDAEVAAATAVASNAPPPVTPLPPVATSPPPLSAVSPPPDATPEQPDNDEDDEDDDEEYDDSDEFDDDDDDDDEEEEEPAVQTTLQKAVQTALAAVQQIRDRANSLRMDIETIKTLEGALAISKLASAIKRAAAGDMDNISNVTKRPNEADCSPATQTDQLKVNTILRLATSGFDEVRGMTFIWQTQLKEAVSREDIIPIAQKLKRIYELMSIYLAA